MTADLAHIESLMQLARQYGATVVKAGDVSIVLGAAPAPAAAPRHAPVVTEAPPIAPELAAAIAEAALDTDEPSAAERAELDMLARWQRGEVSIDEDGKVIGHG